MPLLECRSVSLSHGIEVVLDRVDLSLERGEIVGLVGINGSGKTTLCRIVLNELEPQSGEFHLASGATVGYLSQEPELDLEQTVQASAMAVFAPLRALAAELEEASAALADRHLSDDPDELDRRLHHQSALLAELEVRGGFDYEQRMLATLGALGFGPDDLDRPAKQLSGGEKSRLALARLLCAGCDLLLLDEPTNHLDIPMTEWLESFLRQFPGGVLVVSHDRWFLDHVADTIVELEGGRSTRYSYSAGEARIPLPEDPDHVEQDDPQEHYGAYTHYIRVKEQRRAAEWQAFRSQQKELRRQEDWIRWKLNLRRGKHVTAARSRQKMLDKQDRVDRPSDEPPVVLLEFEPRSRGPNDVVEIRRCSFGYGGERLFENLDLFVRRLQRVGIVGPNGCGKTSLLRLLLGELEPTEGIARLGSTCVVGYYNQEHRDLDLTSTPLETIRAVAPELPVPQIRGFLARFLFFGDEVFRTNESFSGGERSRLVLATLIAQRPNVLLLDEPTNHLDIPSREVLEEALDSFQGTILTVSHDRWFLDRICRRLVVFEPDEVEVFEGAWHRREARRVVAAAAQEALDEAAKRERHRAHLVREKEGRARKRARLAASGGLTAAELEALIEAAEQELRELHEAFGDPELYRDADRVQAAQQAEARLQGAIQELYERWEEQLG